MLEKDIEELEFSVFQDELEVTYFDKSADTEKQETISIEKLETWGMRNTDLFKGSDEEMVGPDHRGEPKYEFFSWEHETFDDLPYKWKVNLIKQFLTK